MCNTYCVSLATVVTRTPLVVTFVLTFPALFMLVSLMYVRD